MTTVRVWAAPLMLLSSQPRAPEQPSPAPSSRARPAAAVPRLPLPRRPPGPPAAARCAPALRGRARPRAARSAPAPAAPSAPSPPSPWRAPPARSCHHLRLAQQRADLRDHRRLDLAGRQTRDGRPLSHPAMHHLGLLLLSRLCIRRLHGRNGAWAACRAAGSASDAGRSIGGGRPRISGGDANTQGNGGKRCRSTWSMRESGAS